MWRTASTVRRLLPRPVTNDFVSPLTSIDMPQRDAAATTRSGGFGWPLPRQRVAEVRHAPEDRVGQHLQGRSARLAVRERWRPDDGRRGAPDVPRISTHA